MQWCEVDIASNLNAAGNQRAITCLARVQVQVQVQVQMQMQVGSVPAAKSASVYRGRGSVLLLDQQRLNSAAGTPTNLRR
jgi:hypothetical protein